MAHLELSQQGMGALIGECLINADDGGGELRIASCDLQQRPETNTFINIPSCSVISKTGKLAVSWAWESSETSLLNSSRYGLECLFIFEGKMSVQLFRRFSSHTAFSALQWCKFVQLAK